MQLLYPLEINDGHHTDQQVDMLCDIRILTDVAAVQTLVKQEFGAGLHILPGREGTGQLIELCRFDVVVDILANLTCPSLSKFFEGVGKLTQNIGFGCEMAERCIARGLLLFHFFAHFQATEAVHGITFQNLCLDFFAAEDVLETLHDRGGARTR